MSWTAPWISAFPGWVNTGRVAARDLPAHVPPAPYLRRRFFLEEEPAAPCRLQLVSAGWHELYVNGEKADDRVLTPCVSQFNVHVNGVEYDLTGRLHQGWNALTVLLGNGLFNGDTSEVWNFLHASWRDFPRMSCVLTVGDRPVLISDPSWRCHESPLVYNSFRSGECYDFSREIPGVLQASFDDSDWKNAHVVRPPAGSVRWEEMEPCRICQRLAPVELRPLKDGEWMADMGTNLTGWARIELTFPEPLAEPREVRMLFGERLKPEDGTADRENVGMFILEGCANQESRALLCAGRDRFVWRQYFTYFGYRYIHIQGKGLQDAKVKVEGLFIHNDFPQAGEWTSSSPALNRLQQVILQSYLSNFTGIPTDCPHREKNGWTGDCSLAMETGLWNFHARKAYKNFLRVFVDGQRPSGELPPIAPLADWYWNCGPGWDALLFVAAWNLLLYCGDDSPAREHYDAMKRYLAFSEQMEVDGLVEYGLGDWCAPVQQNIPATRLTSSAWICDMLEKFAFFARRFGQGEDARQAEARRERMKAALQKEYLREDGTVEQDWPSSLACFLYFGLCRDKTEEARLAARLAEKVRADGHRVNFGIFGAKWIPRVLADHGFGTDALELFLQPNFPGYQDTLNRGATTLWETWNGDASLQHIMFGDPSAWCYQYLGGIRPRISEPAFAAVDLAPQFVPQLTSFQCRHSLPDGRELAAGWRREGKNALYQVRIPQGVKATLHLPGTPPREIPPGDSQYSAELLSL
ncbi:MAG: family 78 glycoside hydrolase catalytic domain [Oligosphaeraceae bacterium]